MTTSSLIRSAFTFSFALSTTLASLAASDRPNILFAISDDQSWLYASAYGTSGVNTPAFDRLAENGVLFEHAFAAAPQCSPSRAAILTARNIWEIEEAGTHASSFPKKFDVFTRVLENTGYHVGYTGKPWSPGDWEVEGWERNPVGDAYNERKLDPPTSAMSRNDYSENFRAFLAEREGDQPFFFWYGASEPHLAYEDGSGRRAGKSLDESHVPPFLPQDEVVQSDILDYALEIEWFDRHLGDMLAMLEAAGELHNTIVVVTSDNGMPFPYAKANLQEMGTHVPLVISGPKFFAGGRRTPALTSLIDLAPTFLEWAKAPPLSEASGQSLLPLLVHGEPHRDQVLTGRERHTHARPDNLGYPSRAIRTQEFLYVWNMKPERWPAGIPEGYEDVDASASKRFLLQNRDEYPELFELAFAKRPEEQLYHIITDPGCLENLATDTDYDSIRRNLRKRLENALRLQGDPRMGENGDIFESYPRYKGKMRDYPGFKKRGEYNPEYQP